MEKSYSTALNLAAHWTPGIPLHLDRAMGEKLIGDRGLELKCGLGDMSGEAHALFEYDGEEVRLKRDWMGHYMLYHGAWRPDPHWTGD